MATLDTFILLTVTWSVTTQTEAVLHFHGNIQYFCIVDSAICSSTIHGMHCCIFMTKAVMQMHHSVMYTACPVKN